MNSPSIVHLSICERCSWPVGEGTKHDRYDQDGNVCIVRKIDTEETLGWKRRRTRDPYKKK